MQLQGRERGQNPRGEQAQEVCADQGSQGAADISDSRSAAKAPGQQEAHQSGQERREPDRQDNALSGNGCCRLIGDYGHDAHAQERLVHAHLMAKDEMGGDEHGNYAAAQVYGQDEGMKLSRNIGIKEAHEVQIPLRIAGYD